MMDSSTSMLGHVELRLRLVYESEDSVSVGTDLPGWRLVGLLPEDVTDPFATDPSAPDMSPPPSTQRGHRFVTEPIALTLDRDEAEGYYLNLTSPQPSLFALIRLPDVAAATAAHVSVDLPQAVAVTASYSEGARWMDGGMVVIRTPLPQAFLAWIAEFAQHHFQVEGKKKGGKGGRFRPSFLSRKDFGEVARTELEQAGQAGRKAQQQQPQRPQQPARTEPASEHRGPSGTED